MSRNLTKNILVILLLLSASGLSAQQWLGRTTGNYSGTYGVYHNASSISDSKYKYYFNFWGRGVNFYNNFLTYNSPIKINHWANNNYDLQYQNVDGKVDMKKDWLLESLNGNAKQFSFNQDIWGPAFMFPVSRRWNMSINTRQRSSFQMYGISEEVARMAHNGLDSSGGIYSGSNALNRNTPYQNGAFGVNMQSFQELSFTLGGIMSKNDHHQLSGGATVKFLRGLGASYVKGSNFNLAATGDNSATINGDLQYAYTDQKSIISPFNDPYGLFSLRSRGAGAGFDLGLNYTYSSSKLKYRSSTGCDFNDKRSDYDFKLALALNDIGGIRYNRNSNVYSYSSTTNANVTAPSNILNSFGTPNQNGFDTIGQKIFTQIGASASNGFNTTLPASFNLQADFRLSKHLYTGIYWNQSLKGFNSTGMRSTSMLSIIPRIETRGFEFSLPVTLSENYKNLYVGAYTRIGPVFFGSDNLGGLLNVAGGGQFTGADIYGGVSFGIGHCHSWWYENKVDPVYMDSTDSVTMIDKDTVKLVKRDTIIKHDTLRVTKRDTVYINKNTKQVIKKDTVYIEKIVRAKPDYTKEKELQRKEEELNKRLKEIELREKIVLDKEKGTYNETEAVKNCKTLNTVLTEENIILRDRATKQNEEIALLKKQVEDLNKKKAQQDSALLVCKTCNENKVKNEAEIVKLKNDVLVATKKITALEKEISDLKKVKNTAEVNKGTDAEKLAKAQKQLDSVNLVLVTLKKDLDNCKKNSTMNNADVVKKAEADKAKAENDARVLKKQNDSLVKVLADKDTELANCRLAGTLTGAEVAKKAQADKAKAENDAKVVRKQNDSLIQVLVTKNNELENCKKNSTSNSAEIVKKAEADKHKAENDARLSKNRADSLAQILVLKNTELENCKKNSTMNSADIVKKAEADKAKAENDARVSKKQADSLAQILTVKNAELELCKKNSAQFDAEVAKNKKCAEDNILLKAEMAEMSKTIGKLNTKNYALSNRADSLLNELKNCSKGTGSEDADLLKKCKETNVELSAEVIRLKATISAKNKSLDSMENIADNLNKKQVELTAQVTKLNTEVAELKAKSSSSNCDELQQQLNDKNAEINKLKNEATTLQNKINTLNNQLSEQRTEYSFMVKQSQRCSQKLDSCMRGLYTPSPEDGGNGGGGGSGSGGGGGGPHEGNNDSGDNQPMGSAEKMGKAIKIGGDIINMIGKTSTATTGSGNSGRPSSKSSETTGSNNSGNETSGTSGTAGSGTGRTGSTTKTSETTNGNSNTTSTGNSDRNATGTNSTTVRR